MKTLVKIIHYATLLVFFLLILTLIWMDISINVNGKLWFKILFTDALVFWANMFGKFHYDD